MQDRRPVSSRSSSIIQAIAKKISQTAITPNQISGFSVMASLLVPLGVLGFSSTGTPSAAGLLLAILGIQLRLLANVLDGLVAVEGGKGSALGALYNEFPDRLADSIILVSLGMAAGIDWLGWLAALLAALTAYIRVFGGALGQPQAFLGPMAKQHRMAVATIALVAQMLLSTWIPSAVIGSFALGLICIGSAWTCVRRTLHIARSLQKSENN